MHLFRCLLLLGLLVAVSACGLFKKGLKHHGHHKRGRHVGGCYVRPKHHGGKFLGVLGFLSKKINPKLRIVKNIFGIYSGIGVAKQLDDVIETVVNLSRGLAVTINVSIPGLGTYFQRLIIASLRVIFCVLRSPWQNGLFIDRWFGRKRCSAPAICGKNFGRKWGWKRYLKGYSSYDELVEFYELGNIEEKVRTLIEVKGRIKITSLKGIPRLIVNAILKLSVLFQRNVDEWDRENFVDISAIVITILSGYGRGLKAGTGVIIADEFTEYLSEVLVKFNFKQKISERTVIIKQELESCSGEYFYDYFKGDIFAYEEDGGSSESSNQNKKGSKATKRSKRITTVDTEIDASSSGYGSGSGSGSGSGGSNSESNSDSNKSASNEKSSSSSDSKSNSNANSNSNAKANANANTKMKTTVTTVEYDEWYDEDGNVISTSKVES